jgi:hypothetical protein
MNWTVTVTTTTTNLKQLMMNYDAGLSPARVPPTYEFRELNLLADSGNGAALIYLGDPNVSASNYSVALSGGMSRYYPPKPRGSPPYYTSQIYLKASTGSLTLHIEGTP